MKIKNERKTTNRNCYWWNLEWFKLKAFSPVCFILKFNTPTLESCFKGAEEGPLNGSNPSQYVACFVVTLDFRFNFKTVTFFSFWGNFKIYTLVPIFWEIIYYFPWHFFITLTFNGRNENNYILFIASTNSIMMFIFNFVLVLGWSFKMSLNLTSALLDGLSTTPTPSFDDTMTSTSTIMSTITTEIPPEDCPVYNKSDDAIIEMFSFW